MTESASIERRERRMERPCRRGAVPLPQPPLVLDDDFIDYPYSPNHGLLACAGLARGGRGRLGSRRVALPDSGRPGRARGGWILGVDHDEFVPRAERPVRCRGPRAPVFCASKRRIRNGS